MSKEAFNKICWDIKQLKIQGAEDVAIAAVKALKFQSSKEAVNKLASLRPTEPCLRNSLKFAASFSNINQGISKVLEHFSSSHKKAASYGSKLVKNGMKIFTHCHSGSVIDILLEAKKQGKHFEVLNTETRPLFQGHKTATELAKAKIPVTMFIDSAAKVAIKKCDMMLIGCDAITTTKFYNKIGSEMFAIIAKKFDVPVYIASNSWKFDSKSAYGQEERIEERNSGEIWKNPPRNVKIMNYAFEKIDPELVEAVISELGIFTKMSFIEEIKKAYPWI